MASLISPSCLGICFLLILSSGSLAPIWAADPPTRKVTVIGTATIKIVPDEMHWRVQASVNDATLAKAKERHDAALAAALKFVKGLGASIKDLQTGGIRFERNMYPGNDPEARTHPFSCSTQFTFTLTDFDRYGAAADALAKIDGVQVQSIDYASSKEEETRRESLKRALINAHDKADDLAQTAGCYIAKPLEIIEGGADNTPRPMMRMTADLNPSTPPAVAGQLEITGSVTATYDLYYK